MKRRNEIRFTPKQLEKLEAVEKKFGTRHAYDLVFPCAVCKAKTGDECKGIKEKGEIPYKPVHFARRLKALLAGLR